MEPRPIVQGSSPVLSCVSGSLWPVTSPPGPYPTKAVTTAQFRITGEQYRLYECIIGHRCFSFWKNEMQPECPRIGSCAACKEGCLWPSDSTLEHLRGWKHLCNIPTSQFKERRYQTGGRNNLSFKNTWNLGVEWPPFGSSGTEGRRLDPWVPHCKSKRQEVLEELFAVGWLHAVCCKK